MPRESPAYDVTVTSRDSVSTGTDTQKRRAIRDLRRVLRKLPPGAKGEVRVRRLDQARGTLIYQAHTNTDGKIVVEEL
jgi:hypothetical protein